MESCPSSSSGDRRGFRISPDRRKRASHRIPHWVRIPVALLWLLLPVSSSLSWNAASATEQKGPIVMKGRPRPVGTISYFASLDREPGRVYHFKGHSYIIEHAIRLLREDGFSNWADFAQSYLLDLASGAVHADAYKGRVRIRLELEALWGLFSGTLYEWDLTCAGGCEHYHNVDDGTGLDLTEYSVLSKAADYIIKILTIYASWFTPASGLVDIDVEVEPDINFAYPSGADLCAEHFGRAVESWRDGSVRYPGRSQRESAMYELGWACHLMADLTVAQHLHEKFIGGHADYEKFAEGMGDETGFHARKGDYVKNFGARSPSPRQLAEELARTLYIQHPENFQQAEFGGVTERRKALQLALPLAERYTAALLARFMTEIGVPKTVPPLRGFVSVKGGAEKIAGAYVFYSPFVTIEQNVDFKDLWQGWDYVRTDSQGMYGIPVLPSRKYLIRVAMPGYSFDGTTDSPNQEFGPKTCPVEYWQPAGAVDSDMLNFYMDRLPAVMKAVIKLPGQDRVELDRPRDFGWLGERPAGILRAGANLSRSGTQVSPALADAVTKSLLAVECTQNVIGVRTNDIGLPDETVLNVYVHNYLDLATGKVAGSDGEVRAAIDNFRVKWKASGRPLSATGEPGLLSTRDAVRRPLDLTDRDGLLALKPKLFSRKSPRPEGGQRDIVSFVPPHGDARETSLLMENGLALVPSAAGTEIEVSTVPGPGYLRVGSVVLLTTNTDGAASLSVRAGSHAGRVRLLIKVVKNPAAPHVLPASVLEIAVQPRLKGPDPKPEIPIGMEPRLMLNVLQATPLGSGPKPDVLRTKVRVGRQGIVIPGSPLEAGEKRGLEDVPLTGEAKVEPKVTAPRASPALDISGTWKSSIGLIYEINQTGNTFTWHVASLNQKAEGTISGDIVKASWRGLVRMDSATGRIIRNAAGRAVRIEWSNGVVFTR